MKEEGTYLTALVNAGIMTRNEARAKIRLDTHNEDMADQLILPANVAGSAVNPGQGGAPKKPTDGTNPKPKTGE